MSKGDWKRPRGRGVSKKQYDDTFEEVFGKKALKTWNPEDDTDEQEKQFQDQSTSERGRRGEASSPDVCTPNTDGEGSRLGSGEAQESSDSGGP